MGNVDFLDLKQAKEEIIFNLEDVVNCSDWKHKESFLKASYELFIATLKRFRKGLPRWPMEKLFKDLNALAGEF